MAGVAVNIVDGGPRLLERTDRVAHQLGQAHRISRGVERGNWHAPSWLSCRDFGPLADRDGHAPTGRFRVSFRDRGPLLDSRADQRLDRLVAHDHLTPLDFRMWAGAGA